MGLVGHTFYLSMYKEDLYELKASWSAYEFQDCWQYIERHCWWRKDNTLLQKRTTKTNWKQKINKKILKNDFGNWSQRDGSDPKITFCSFRGPKHPYQAAHNLLKHKFQRIHTLICPFCVSVLFCTWLKPQQLKICMEAERNMRQLACLKAWYKDRWPIHVSHGEGIVRAEWFEE